MKLVKTTTLSIAAVCALSAFGTTSAFAFANLPHYGQCEATGTGTEYSSATCTKPQANGGHFWHPISTLANTIPFTTLKATATGEAVLETMAGNTIHCNAQKSSHGEFGPGNELKKVVLEFQGCEALGMSCKSTGQAAGNVNTNNLIGEPGIVKKETNEQKNIDGTDLRVEPPGTVFAEFDCGPVAAVVRGGVVIKAQEKNSAGTIVATTNKMFNKISLEFIVQPIGKQNTEIWTPNGEGFSNSTNALIIEHLETSLAGNAFEGSGLSLTTVLKTNPSTTKIELRQCRQTISCPN